MVLRLSVPAAGGFRVIAADLTLKVAEHLGAAIPEADSVTDALEQLARRVARPELEASIDFEFRRSGHELLIEARCEGQASELRYPLAV